MSVIRPADAGKAGKFASIWELLGSKSEAGGGVSSSELQSAGATLMAKPSFTRSFFFKKENMFRPANALQKGVN